MKKLYLLSTLSFIFLFSCKTQMLDQKRTYIPNENGTHASSFQNTNTRSKNKSATYYFIRHTEAKKSTDNPHLSGTGLKKAHLFAKYFANKKIDTIYSTNLKRTVETAEIIAKSKNIGIGFYDPSQMDYKRFVKTHKHNDILIIGHSNTTPAFVNKLIKEHVYSQMVENNYSDIYRIVFVNGKVLTHTVFDLEDEIQKTEDAKLDPKELKKVLKERKRLAKELEKVEK